MPELPEIETVARGLKKHILGKTIASLKLQDHKKRVASPNQIKQFVVNKKVKAIRRRAKWLIVDLTSDYSFIVHLKMTGQLLFSDGTPTFLGGHTMESDTDRSALYPNKHTRVTFNFKGKRQLFFQDSRRFGYVELYPTKTVADYFKQKKLALELIDGTCTFEYFTKQLKRRARTNIKAALLDQSVVSGLGNIYVDDTLNLAKIKPTRVVGLLKPKQLKAIYLAGRTILNKAINLGGTSFSSFLRVDGKLGQYWDKRRAYGRTGEPCLNCKTLIIKTRVAGRGTHYCPRCQK